MYAVKENGSFRVDLATAEQARRLLLPQIAHARSRHFLLFVLPQDCPWLTVLPYGTKLTPEVGGKVDKRGEHTARGQRGVRQRSRRGRKGEICIQRGEEGRCILGFSEACL